MPLVLVLMSLVAGMLRGLLGLDDGVLRGRVLLNEFLDVLGDLLHPLGGLVRFGGANLDLVQRSFLGLSGLAADRLLVNARFLGSLSELGSLLLDDRLAGGPSCLDEILCHVELLLGVVLLGLLGGGTEGLGLERLGVADLGRPGSLHKRFLQLLVLVLLVHDLIEDVVLVHHGEELGAVLLHLLRHLGLGPRLHGSELGKLCFLALKLLELALEFCHHFLHFVHQCHLMAGGGLRLLLGFLCLLFLLFDSFLGFVGVLVESLLHVLEFFIDLLLKSL